MLLDTSGLLAAIDRSQAEHDACADVLRRCTGPLLLSPFVLAELDYLLATRVGADAEVALLEEVGRSTYTLESFDAAAVGEAAAVVRRYATLHVGLADASIVVLAGRHGARDVLTLDRRHFDVLRRPNGKPFRIHP
jgi:hypothetical protein